MWFTGYNLWYFIHGRYVLVHGKKYTSLFPTWLIKFFFIIFSVWSLNWMWLPASWCKLFGWAGSYIHPLYKGKLHFLSFFLYFFYLNYIISRRLKERFPCVQKANQNWSRSSSTFHIIILESLPLHQNFGWGKLFYILPY